MDAVIEKKQLLNPHANDLELTVINGGADYALNLSESGHMNTLSWGIKRLFDLTASILGVLCISPLLLCIALIIKLESRGPVFFRQERVGLNGKLFYMFKFRSMRQDADKLLEELLVHNDLANNGNSNMFKMFNDPRVTRVGRFLRKYSLDELPQLLNVILGDMSLVGPRPSVMREVVNYEPWHHVRLGTVPGMTGLWQVSGRSSILDFDDVVRLDHRYISTWSLMSDIRILFRTVPVVIFGKGAC